MNPEAHSHSLARGRDGSTIHHSPAGYSCSPQGDGSTFLLAAASSVGVQLSTHKPLGGSTSSSSSSGCGDGGGNVGNRRPVWAAAYRTEREATLQIAAAKSDNSSSSRGSKASGTESSITTSGTTSISNNESSAGGGGPAGPEDEEQDGPAVRAALALLRFYRQGISPLMQSTCR